MQHSTRHMVGIGALRFLLAGPLGILEQRVYPPYSALIFHAFDCAAVGHCADDRCRQEGIPGDQITALWRPTADDAIIIELLDTYYLAWLALSEPETPAEAGARGYERLAQARDWQDFR